MKFDIEDMRRFADRYRGKYVTSGPHWSTIIRFPILFDEYEKAIARAEAAEAENAELKDRIAKLEAKPGLAPAGPEPKETESLVDWSKVPEVVSPEEIRLFRQNLDTEVE